MTAPEPRVGAVFDVGGALAIYWPDRHPCGATRAEPWLILHDYGGSEWVAELREGAQLLGQMSGRSDEVAHLRAEVERLRARVHEAVNETQRRYAPYQSRCDRFDVWATWARQRFDEVGGHDWRYQSEADRLVVLSLLEERDIARADLAELQARFSDPEEQP